MNLDSQRLAYLAAMGIDVYVRRAPHGPMPASKPLIGSTSDVNLSAAALASPALEWSALEAAVAACERCELHRTRTQTVFGRGDHKARWLVVGEAPGAEEDRQGQPFVGRAGQLLDTMLRALGLGRDQFYVANVLKCRPPGNRDPRPEEAASCRSYLDRQIALVAPVLVLAVGRIAAQSLLGTDMPLGKLRGRIHTLAPHGVPLVVTYHPAYLLRSPGEKRKAWQDLVFARQVFGRHAAHVEAG